LTLPRRIVLALCVLALGGCGQAGGSQAGSSATTTTTAAHSPSTPIAHSPSVPADPCAPRTRTICITAADEGRTIAVRVGASFTVELRAPRRSFGPVSVSGAKALELIGASHSGAAAEAYYRALAPGRVVLRSAERPVCVRGRACPEFILLWQAYVLLTR
jgi:hypothetical protein